MAKTLDECTAAMSHDITPDGKFTVEFKITGFTVERGAIDFMFALQAFTRIYAASTGGHSGPGGIVDAKDANHAIAVGQSMKASKQ